MKDLSLKRGYSLIQDSHQDQEININKLISNHQTLSPKYPYIVYRKIIQSRTLGYLYYLLSFVSFQFE